MGLNNFNPKSRIIAEMVEVKEYDGKLFMYNKPCRRWQQLADGWFIHAESVKTEPWVTWENPSDPKASIYTPIDWALLPDWLKGVLEHAGFKKVWHIPANLPESHAETKSGFRLVNFRWINHRLYADLIR